MTIEVCDLGTWGAVALVAEYDAECDAIRVNARVVERVRTALGDVAARTFVDCAIAHECFHRDHPDATESEAHAYARERTGAVPGAFEAVLR